MQACTDCCVLDTRFLVRLRRMCVVNRMRRCSLLLSVLPLFEEGPKVVEAAELVVCSCALCHGCATAVPRLCHGCVTAMLRLCYGMLWLRDL